MAQEMADQVECLCSLISLLMHIFHVLRKAISMALCSNPSTHSPSLPPLPWKRISDTPVSARKRSKEASDGTILSSDDASFFLASEGEELAVNHPILDSPPRDSCSEFDILMKKEHMLEDIDIRKGREHLMVGMVRSESLPTGTVRGRKALPKLRKRPSMIVIPPEPWPGLGFSEEGMGKESMEKELEVEGSDYCLASRKGSRHVLEDGYKSITNIHGDPKQAFFGVFDGHGGRAAVDFVSEKLGTNIIEAMSQMNKEDQLEPAIRAGYLTTDTEFLNLGVGSGACAATVILRNGEMHVSNVGDCRVVISRRGEATALTRDHSARREDERIRIENSGGYVTCHNGIWRVQDSLAVSRSIGDVSLKQWVISEPETTKVGLTPDCEFLIMASDGLWNKVSNQEAADVVSRNKNSMKSCKELVELSSLRGSRDDITVMVVGLQRFAKLVG